jgi:hypothetical protein
MMRARVLLRARTAVAAACTGASACPAASAGAASVPAVCLPSAGRPQLSRRDPAFALRLAGRHSESHCESHSRLAGRHGSCGSHGSPTGSHGKPTTRERRGRPVRLGMVTVGRYWPFATHWAVQVQDTWYEVGGASKEETRSSMVVVASEGQRSGKGADPSRFGHVGYSRRYLLVLSRSSTYSRLTPYSF